MHSSLMHCEHFLCGIRSTAGEPDQDNTQGNSKSLWVVHPPTMAIYLGFVYRIFSHFQNMEEELSFCLGHWT